MSYTFNTRVNCPRDRPDMVMKRQEQIYIEVERRYRDVLANNVEMSRLIVLLNCEIE